MDAAIWWAEHGLTNLGHNMYILDSPKAWKHNEDVSIMDIGSNADDAKEVLKWIENRISKGILSIRNPVNNCTITMMGRNYGIAADLDNLSMYYLAVQEDNDIWQLFLTVDQSY